MTPKQRVLQKCPCAYCNTVMYTKVVWRGPILGTKNRMLGSAKTARQAWADAASRLKDAQPVEKT